MASNAFRRLESNRIREFAVPFVSQGGVSQLVADDFFEAAAVGFPTQFSGLRIRRGAANLELCLVATADAPTGMGGQPRMRKGSTTYAVYLVETGDSNASPMRLRTTTGTKAIRLKT